jgi:hypothetical protein
MENTEWVNSLDAAYSGADVDAAEEAANKEWDEREQAMEDVEREEDIARPKSAKYLPVNFTVYHKKEEAKMLNQKKFQITLNEEQLADLVAIVSLYEPNIETGIAESGQEEILSIINPAWDNPIASSMYYVSVYEVKNEVYKCTWCQGYACVPKENPVNQFDYLKQEFWCAVDSFINESYEENPLFDDDTFFKLCAADTNIKVMSLDNKTMVCLGRTPGVAHGCVVGLSSTAM